MLILPIVNRNRILNVEVKLKSADKIRTGVKISDAPESEVIVNGKRFSDSSYKDDRSDGAALEFIRTNSVRFKRNYLITTRQENSSSAYDVYEVSQPPRRVNDGLDNLYTSVITDMRKEIPGIPRGRYLSFDTVGLGEVLTDEKISRLERIVNDVKDSSQWPGLFEKAGVADLPRILEFMNNFDCMVVSDTTIKEETLEDMIASLAPLQTRETRNLMSYYNTAIKNKDIYAKLSYINKVLYGKPLSLIQSQSQRQKQLVKAQGEFDFRNAA